MLGIGIVLQFFRRIKTKGRFQPPRHNFICHQKNKFKFILNLFKFQRNQDKRPVPATPTPFHLSLKTLSGRLKRICLNMSNNFDVDLFHPEFWKHFYRSLRPHLHKCPPRCYSTNAPRHDICQIFYTCKCFPKYENLRENAPAHHVGGWCNQSHPNLANIGIAVHCWHHCHL